jgi:hypothetical protein
MTPAAARAAVHFAGTWAYPDFAPPAAGEKTVHVYPTYPFGVELVTAGGDERQAVAIVASDTAPVREAIVEGVDRAAGRFSMHQRWRQGSAGLCADVRHTRTPRRCRRQNLRAEPL